MIKVLIILYTLGIGGVEKVCYEIASNIDKEKYSCDFLVSINPEEHQYYEDLLINLGCRVYKGGEIQDKESKKRFLNIEKELIEKERYHVVHSNMDFMNVWTLRCAKKLHVPVRISHVHTMLKNQSWRNAFFKLKQLLYKKMLCQYANCRIGCSTAVVKEYYGNAKSEVIINGFDIKRFTSLKKYSSGEKRIISVGRLSDSKNPEFIIEIMKKLTVIDSGYQLFWIGDGEKRADINRLIIQNNLSEKIVMVGETTDIIQHLQRCNIALFPSKFEGLGIAIVEAQLAGCLTYYSDIVPEEAEVGFGVRLPLDISAEQWAERINDDMKKGKRVNCKLQSENAELYDIKRMIMRIERLYE